ncbi:MAG: hypothetical protein ACJAQR_001482, partial [Bacteroidia bacterium]
VAKLNNGGHLILCGFLDQDFDEQQTAASAYGLTLVGKHIDNNWLQTEYILA